MRCSLCKEIFNVPEIFDCIFSFPKICPYCQSKYDPILKEEIIPIDNGEIAYLYLYEQNSLNLEQRNYLDRNLKVIYLHLIKNSSGAETLVFLDFQSLNTLKNWIIYLLPMQQIIFFSLDYFDLSYFKILY